MEASRPTVWQLARMAGTTDPDSPSSPGAIFLASCITAAEVARQDARDWGTDLDDAVAQAADGVVPIYTHDAWRVFVDLAAYTTDEAEECWNWAGRLDDPSMFVTATLGLLAVSVIGQLVTEEVAA